MAQPTNDAYTSTVNGGIYGGTAAPALTLTAPTPATTTAGVASGNFTVNLLNGRTAVTVTPAATPGATITPSSFTVSKGSPTAYFTVNSLSAAVHLISIDNNRGITNPVPVSLTVAAMATPTLTLNQGQTSSTVGVAATGWSVSNSGTVSGAYAVAASPGEVTFTNQSGTLSAGGSVNISPIPLTSGSKSISLTSSTSGATIIGSPRTLTGVATPAPPPPPPAPAPAPTGSLVQYISHDGDAVGNTTRSSAPNGAFWNTVLEQRWTNANGDWLDSAQTAQGAAPYGSSAAVATVGQRLSISVTALVQRWRSNSLNRGIFLRQRANAFPLAFAGRTDATDADRPKLVVVTDTGTFTLTARCNASWANNQNVTSRAAAFDTSSGYNAILQFDLSSVTGTVTSATLGMTVTTLTQTGAILDAYEANPPTLYDPADNASPTLGIGAGGNFAALLTHPDLLIGTDFATGKPTVQETFSTNPVDYIANEAARTLDTERGTTYLRAFIANGALSGMNIKLPIVTAATAGGVTQAAQRRDSAHGHCRFYMEDTFGGLTDRLKIPAMGAQLGYWVTTNQGYWQSVTGNGGSPGTGLKVIGTGGRVEYHGHSSRLTTGYRCADVSAYADYTRIATYIYNLDQVGGFPTEDVIPGVVLKRGRWYDFDHYIALNSMSGAQDGLGNYDTANADGIYRLSINGLQVLNKTNYRWRRHAEFCVQGFWVDVYHGGTNPSDRTMYYRVNEVAVATSYIGPVAVPVQISGTTWTPNVDGSGNVLATDYPQLPLLTTRLINTNKLDDVVPFPRYATVVGNSDGSPGIINAWSGAARDYITGDLYISGGGHGDSWVAENGVYRFDTQKLRFSVTVPRSANNTGQRYNTTTNQFEPLTQADGIFGTNSPLTDGRAAGEHTYWAMDWVPGSLVGNTRGAVINYMWKEVFDLDTGLQDTIYWGMPNQYDNFGASGWFTVLRDGWKGFWPYSDFNMRAWDFSPTARTSTQWSTLVGGTSRGAPIYPAVPSTSGGFQIGSRWFRFGGVILRMPERREVAQFCYQTDGGTPGFYARRLRLGQAVDATSSYTASTNWGSFFDTLTVTSPDGSLADFQNAANWGDPNPGLYAAGAVWDNEDGTAYVWGRNGTPRVYKITGLATGNNVAIEKLAAGTASLHGSLHGVYDRVSLIKRSGLKFLVAVDETREFAQIVRLT